MERIYGGSASRPDAMAENLDDLRRLLAVRDTGADWSAKDRARLQPILEALCQDPGWWRRLYAAALLARNPDLATSDMTLRLKHDPNALVSDTLSR